MAYEKFAKFENRTCGSTKEITDKLKVQNGHAGCILSVKNYDASCSHESNPKKAKLSEITTFASVANKVTFENFGFFHHFNQCCVI